MSMGCDYLCKAEYLLETGAFNEVECLALRAIYKATTRQQTCMIVCAKMTIARLLILQGRQREVNDILVELQTLQMSEKDRANLDVIDNCIGYLNATLRNLSGIPTALQNTDILMSRSKKQGAAFSYIIYSKSLLLNGEYLKFDALFETIHTKLSTFQNQLGIIHNYIHEAIAGYHLFGMDFGITELQKAFNVALQDGIIMPFIENVSMLYPMLSNHSLKIPPGYIDSILQYSDQYSKYNCIQNNIGILSPREAEVLALIEKGYNNEMLSEMLFISQHTVKRHIQNIYMKLGVNNKIAAIKKFKGAS